MGLGPTREERVSLAQRHGRGVVREQGAILQHASRLAARRRQHAAREEGGRRLGRVRGRVRARARVRVRVRGRGRGRGRVRVRVRF